MAHQLLDSAHANAFGIEPGRESPSAGMGGRANSRGRRRRGLGHIDAEVGAKLREYRIRAGLSQTELGGKTGVTFQQIQKYENGTNAIATARLPSVCSALNISPNDLYGTLYTTGKRREAIPQLSTFATKLALAIDELPKRLRMGIAELVRDLTGKALSE